MNKLVSKYPWKDITIIVWCFFIIGLIELGIRHFWVVVLNATVASALRRIIEAKRPVEYDIRLQPLTDSSAESYGFPSMESYMAVVVMGHLCISLWSFGLVPLAILVVLLVGFSRVYSQSRFPHQIVGSWISGLVGLVASLHCCDKISFHTMNDLDHGACAAFILGCVVIQVALSAENNDSRLFVIPKAEFSRVLGNILSGGGEAVSDQVDAEGDWEGQDEQGGLSSSRSELDGDAADESSSSLAAARRRMGTLLRQRRPQKAGRGRRGNKDSLFFLQQTLQLRESARGGTGSARREEDEEGEDLLAHIED